VRETEREVPREQKRVRPAKQNKKKEKKKENNQIPFLSAPTGNCTAMAQVVVVAFPCRYPCPSPFKLELELEEEEDPLVEPAQPRFLLSFPSILQIPPPMPPTPDATPIPRLKL